MRRIFYGWYMVGAAVGLQFLQAGLVSQAFGAYLAVLSEEQNWSKTALSGAAALQQMEVALLGPVLGWLLDRFGPKIFVRAGVVVFGTGLCLLSQVQTLPQFYGAFIVIALGTSLCGFFPLNVSLIHWFERKRARALSAMSIGLALGGIMVPLVAQSLTTYGWRATALASGIFAICVGLPLAFVIRNSPHEHGEVPDGIREDNLSAADGRDPSEKSTTRDFTAREALRTSAFWLISLGHGFALFVVHAVAVHAITHLKEGLGYSIAEASLVISLVTMSQMGGVGLGWLIGERWEKRYIAAGCMLAHAVGLLLLTYAASLTMVVAFAVLHGAAWGLRGPFHAGDPRRLFRPQRHRHDPRPVVHDHRHRPGRRADHPGYLRRHHRRLPARLHHPRGARRRGLDLFRAGEKTEVAARLEQHQRPRFDALARRRARRRARIVEGGVRGEARGASAESRTGRKSG
jgi:sugar phosphate permease